MTTYPPEMMDEPDSLETYMIAGKLKDNQSEARIDLFHPDEVIHFTLGRVNNVWFLYATLSKEIEVKIEPLEGFDSKEDALEAMKKLLAQSHWKMPNFSYIKKEQQTTEFNMRRRLEV